MDNFLETFRNEASDLLAELEGALLKLDSDMGNTSLLNEVFRVMHTFKGASAMFGFENIGKLTHNLENIYDQARDNQLAISEDILNITLEITDFIKELIKNNDQSSDNKKVDDFIQKLDKITELKTDDIIKKAPETLNIATYYIVFNPSEQILFRGINILSIFKELSTLGNYKIIQHEFDDENKKYAWGIYLVTDQLFEDIENVFLFVIDDCNITKVADFNIFSDSELNEAIDKIKKDTKKSADKKNIFEISKEIEKAIDDSLNQQKENKTKETESQLSTKQSASTETKRINVDAEKLDNLMNLVSDLVTSNAMLSMAVRNKDLDVLEGIAEKFERLTRQFRDSALSVRLVSIQDLLLRFRRLIRDLSKELNKEIEFIIEGENTEMDKNIIDNLSDPLIHIFRNSIDHGIEPAKERIKKNKPKKGIIKLSAFYSGTYVYITIQDDGAGIDTEKIRKLAVTKNLIDKDTKLTDKETYNLLFKPGFSTAKKITDVSGRGVGLDVVKNKITELQGEIEIDSEIDLGTTFTIKLQQTISIIDTLLIKSSNTLYLIPQSNIKFCVQDEYNTLFANLNKRIEFEEEVIPFINLREIFNLNGETPEQAKLIIVDKNNMKFAIAADEIIGEHQAVVKPLGHILKHQDYFTGVSQLGDGSLAFMIDLSHIQEYATKIESFSDVI